MTIDSCHLVPKHHALINVVFAGVSLIGIALMIGSFLAVNAKLQHTQIDLAKALAAIQHGVCIYN